jgi:aminoglycoside/choline kinase family phosphotransferase
VESSLESRFTALVRDAFGPGVALERSAALAGDASTRRYARLWLEGEKAPATAVVMILADRGTAMSSDELAVFKEAPKELPYLNVSRFLETLGVAVPEVYFDASERGLVLLEDIGDTPLWDVVCNAAADEVERWYRLAIDELLLIQIKGTQQPDPTCIAFQQAFDAKLFNWEFEHFIEYGIERRLGSALPDDDATVLRASFGRIAHRLDAQPRFLNHRDYHSWNLFIVADRVRVIDFQDALMAPAPYDLATLLGDRDTPQAVTPAIEARLLDYYRRRWQEIGGPPLSADELKEAYFLCALQKALKVVGRFYYLDLVKQKPAYLRYIPATVRQIRRILPYFPEHAEMAAVLLRYLPACEQ